MKMVSEKATWLVEMDMETRSISRVYAWQPTMRQQQSINLGNRGSHYLFNHRPPAPNFPREKKSPKKSVLVIKSRKLGWRECCGSE